MTLEHIIYIPGVILLGISVGYVLGARAVRDEVSKMKRRAKE